METNDHIIISLGGSIVVPELPDPKFIADFRSIILAEVAKGRRCLIIVGGGKTCRQYQEALSAVRPVEAIDLDWMGIYATQLNAEFVRLSFGTDAADSIINSASLVAGVTASIIVGGGDQPGGTTDANAVLMANALGAKKIINLSNIDYVYDSDPRKNPDAKKFEKLSWKEYMTFIPAERVPGGNYPFDPIASAAAEEAGIEVAFIAGKDLPSLENYLDGKAFVGTTIS